jgi:diadenosine tetraphosphate (Ap4A) HIT family hydrolase
MKKILEEIYINKNFDAHQDWDIPIPGFVIVAAKDKTKKSLSEFSDKEVSELFLLVKKVRVAMMEVLNIEVVYIFQNEDTDHGFHVWMFPRYSWMEEFGKKIQSVRPIMEFARLNMFTEETLEEVKKSAEKLREYLK